MSASGRKPGTANPPSTTRSSNDDHPSTRGITNSPTRASAVASTGTVAGLNKSPSVKQSSAPVSARAAARRPGGSSRSSAGLGTPSRMAESTGDEDSRLENAQLMEDLRNQVVKAELASEQYQKQLEVLQIRLDEVMGQQHVFEEDCHQKESQVEALQVELKDVVRQKRDAELVQERERSLLLKDCEDQAVKEEELQAIIHRLNDTIKQKEIRSQLEGDRPSISRSSSFRNRSSPDRDGQFAPSVQLERSPSRNNSKILLQKDKMIESLRLELAEVQIKIAEMEHMGDGRIQEVERNMLQTKATNARLMEENESFQLLLSEATLKGDFMQDSRGYDNKSTLGTLADELGSVGEGAEGESDAYRKLEAETKTLRDGNKALTLYIDKIIGRLLQHEGFEHIIHDKDEPPELPMKIAGPEKALPPPPGQAPSLLQRAKSVVSGQGGRPPRARPMSMMPAPTTVEVAPTVHEDPDTAPSLPLTRGHRRSRSDQAQQDAGAAAVVGQMYRGTPLRTTSGGPMSPGLGPQTARQPFFNPSNSGTSRVSSGNAQNEQRPSSSNSVTSERSTGPNSTDAPSPPRGTPGNPTAIPGAVMKQNQLRPLRLVRENNAIDEDEAARKKANRGSLMGWFYRGSGNVDE